MVVWPVRQDTSLRFSQFRSGLCIVCLKQWWKGTTFVVAIFDGRFLWLEIVCRLVIIQSVLQIHCSLWKNNRKTRRWFISLLLGCACIFVSHLSIASTDIVISLLCFEIFSERWRNICSIILLRLSYHRDHFLHRLLLYNGIWWKWINFLSTLVTGHFHRWWAESLLPHRGERWLLFHTVVFGYLESKFQINPDLAAVLKFVLLSLGQWAAASTAKDWGGRLLFGCDRKTRF